MKASLDIPEKINHTDDVYMRCPDGTGVGITEGSTEGTGEGNMDGLKEGEGVGFALGIAVIKRVGAIDGIELGLELGRAVGEAVGLCFATATDTDQAGLALRLLVALFADIGRATARGATAFSGSGVTGLATGAVCVAGTL